jgi:branched-chain amino acid transport system substrate-binding protein
MKTLRRTIAAWLTVLALASAACSGASGPGAQPQGAAQPAKPAAGSAQGAAPAGEPIKIGEIAEYTGPFAATNLRAYETLEWLVQRDGGQIAGRPVQFIRAEDQAKVDVFQSEARRLIEAQQVDMIVGPINSGVASSAQQWMNQQPTVWIIPEVGTVHYYPGDNAVRSVATSWHMALPDLGKYFAENHGIRKAVTIGLDYAAGRDFVDGEVQKIFPAGGIEVLRQFWVPVGNADFGPVISQIPTGDDVMVTGALWSADAVRFMQQATDFGLKSKVKLIVFPAAFANDDVGMDTLGPAAEGMYVYNEMPPPDYPSPEYQEFVKAFRQQFKVAPGYATKGYITYLQIKQAVESLQGRVDDRQALVRALRQPLKTPIGEIAFDNCGNAIRTLYLKQIKVVDGQDETSLIKDFPNSSIPCPQPAEWKG